MRALLIEDNDDIADCMQQSLLHMDIASDRFAKGQLGLDACKVAAYDLLVLDLNLPDMDGLAVLAKVKKAQPEIPVLIVSARISIEDRVKGLDLGADDYLIKPFDLTEWEARVRALFRRGKNERDMRIQFSSLEFDQTTREFWLSGEVLELSPRERSVLELLIRKNGGVMSKESIADGVFSFADEAGVSSIEIYIHRLRKRLENSAISISTKRGLGYALQKMP
ncbi:MAG: response regulator [Paraglaciecola sp.]|nr:response regulator [Paraglaciecola sp.]